MDSIHIAMKPSILKLTYLHRMKFWTYTKEN